MLNSFLSFISSHADALISLGALLFLNVRRNQTRATTLEAVKAAAVDTAVQLAEKRLGVAGNPADPAIAAKLGNVPAQQ